MVQMQSISDLKIRHAELEGLLSTEDQRPHPDEGVVIEIKRKKLKIKDLIADLER